VSVTILQQPAAIAFSRNPMLFRLQTDALKAQAGVKHIGWLGPFAFIGGLAFTLKYNGLTLSFTSAAVPDNSGYQLHSYPGVTPAADLINQLAADLRKNFYLNRDFDIQPASAPYYSVQLTARKTGAAFNIAFTNTENTQYQLQQAGADEALQPNFKLYTELWVQNADHSDFVKVSDAFLEVDEKGEADIDLSGSLTTALLADGYDRPDVRFPAANADLKSCRKYYLTYAEAYGEKQVIRQINNTDVKTALLGGISKEKLEEFDFPGYFTSNGPLRFLKQEPVTVAIRPEQQEYLTLVTFNQGFASLQMRFLVYFTDGSTQTVLGDTFGAVEQYQKFTWPVGFEQNHFQLLSPVNTKIVQKYEATVFNDAGLSISETKTYFLDYKFQPYTRFFLYLSSFGSYDTKLTFGKNSNQYEVISASANRSLQGDFHLVDGEQLDYTVELNNTETYTTGYRKMPEIRSFRDLFLSLDKIVVRKGRAYPVVFASKTINEYKDGENLHALTFEMGFRFKEVLWTFDEKDDIPVGLYLNLPGGSGVPNMPLPFPINYFDGRYYLKTETYNRAEIDAKLASMLAIINMNNAAANGRISQLSLTVQNQISNFNTTLSQYYTAAQINTIIQQIAMSGIGGTAGQSTFISLEGIPFPANAPSPFIVPWTDDLVAKFGDEPGFVKFNILENDVFIKPAYTVNRDTTPIQVEFVFQPGNDAGEIFLIGTGKTGQSLSFNGLTYTLVWSADMVAQYGPEPAFKTFQVLYQNLEFVEPRIVVNRQTTPVQIEFDFGPDAKQGEIYIIGNMGIQKVSSTTKIEYGDPRWNADHTQFTEKAWAGTQPVIWLNRVRDLTAAEDGLTYLAGGGFQINPGTIYDAQSLTIFF
jgi:hypothetical protein